MATKTVNLLNQLFEYGKGRNLVFANTEDETLNGRNITIDGKELLNFGNCSVLGLEKHPALIEGVVDAVKRYGTQFSSSRTYASVGMYKELEGMLGNIFDRPVLVSASTTLGHLAAIPTLINDEDAVVLDMQVHSSMQMATEMLKARGVTVSIIRHNDMDSLEKKIRQLKGNHKKVWYFADGVYSMYGDFAPFAKLEELLDKYPQFNLYIDDAHGMTWAGKNGVGVVRSHMEHHERMVLAVSLNKTFAAGGGCLVFPDEASCDLVRNCGGTMIFSGPVQPPMLGAALASARMHLSGEIEPLQQQLQELIDHTNQGLARIGLPQFQQANSPLFFVPVGMPRISYDIILAMREKGFFMNPAAFPATPMKRSGIRFLVTLHHSKADIDAMLDELVIQHTKFVTADGSSPELVAKAFSIPTYRPQVPMRITAEQKSALSIEMQRSINDMNQKEWDDTFAGKGNFNASSLQMIEEVFTTSPEPENQWDFFYFTARDQDGAVVLKTFFTSALIKEDMFSSSAVSEKVEELRQEDPMYMTTRSVALGSLITKGEHLFLDRSHPQWKDALRQLVDKMQETVESTDAGQLLLREFMGEQDQELQTVLYELGLVSHELPNVCMINEMTWKDESEYMDRLSSRYRYDLKREVIKHRDKFVMTTQKPQTEEEIKACYELYERVFERSFEINVFKLPLSFFRAMCAHGEYEVIRLFIKDGDRPIEELEMAAVMFSHVNGATYSAMIVGLDYRVLRSHEVYKQILYRTVWQAWYHKCQTLDLAFTADAVKKKVGARPHKATAYLQVMDHYNQAVLASMAKAS